MKRQKENINNNKVHIFLIMIKSFFIFDKLNVLLMNKIIFIIIFTYITMKSFSQTYKNEVSLSFQSIWNKYQIAQSTLQQLFNQGSGESWSNGIYITYSRFFYKDFFVIGGVGINKQNFNLVRFFYYPSVTDFGYTTNNYYYENAQWIAGLGYDYKTHKRIGLKAKTMFCQSYSFKQYYKPNGKEPPYIPHNTYVFGNSIVSSLSVYYSLTNMLSLGIDAILPLFTKWRNDPIFGNENPNENSSPQSSFGYGASLNYHF